MAPPWRPYIATTAQPPLVTTAPVPESPRLLHLVTMAPVFGHNDPCTWSPWPLYLVTTAPAHHPFLTDIPTNFPHRILILTPSQWITKSLQILALRTGPPKHGQNPLDKISVPLDRIDRHSYQRRVPRPWSKNGWTDFSTGQCVTDFTCQLQSWADLAGGN